MEPTGRRYYMVQQGSYQWCAGSMTCASCTGRSVGDPNSSLITYYCFGPFHWSNCICLVRYAPSCSVLMLEVMCMSAAYICQGMAAQSVADGRDSMLHACQMYEVCT